MGCISSKAISIREELRHGFQSRSAVWEELLTSHSSNDQLLALVCSSNNAETAPDVALTRCHTLRESENMSGLKDDKRSLSFHTDALLERTSLEDCFPSASVETGWKRKAIARGLKSLDISPLEFPPIATLNSPGTYVTPKFGTYNAPTMPQNETQENTVFTPELLAAFEDCMQQLQVEEDTILRLLIPE